MASNNRSAAGDTGSDLRAARPHHRAVLVYLGGRALDRDVCHACGDAVDVGADVTVRAASSPSDGWQTTLFCDACGRTELQAVTCGAWEFVVRGRVAGADASASAGARPVLTATAVLDCSPPGEGARRR